MATASGWLGQTFSTTSSGRIGFVCRFCLNGGSDANAGPENTASPRESAAARQARFIVMGESPTRGVEL